MDISLSNGVLTIILPNKKGTYVINRQIPTKQIWFSSPLSGPKRFNHIAGLWRCNRTDDEIIQLMSIELSKIFCKKMKIH
ncbi:hypothetical protein A3Q56_07658 [Intoshia linei]|uniref:Ferroxidase n=1 Tax=Intoshia linei TaxID=1819745 RepID=A0A177ARL5_9BILA|nr:hypothetical protein A3Q56_07658 [Intoshia linei]